MKQFMTKHILLITDIYYFLAMFVFFVPRQTFFWVYPIRLLMPLVGILLVLFYDTRKIINKKLFIPFFLLYIFASANGIKNEDILMLFILSVLYQNDFKRFILYNFIFIASFILITTPLSHLGILSNNILVESRGIRHGFFFSHPNQFGLAATSCLYTLYYLISTHTIRLNKIIFLAIVIFVTYFLNSIVMTRTNTLLCILLIVITIYSLFKNKFKRLNLDKFTKYLYIVFPLTILLIFVTTILYPYHFTFIDKLNSALSGRIQLQSNALINYSLPLFGLNMYFDSGALHGVYDVIDSGIFNYIYTYGLLFFIFTMSSITYMIYKTSKNNQYIPILILYFCLTGITENVLLSFVYNPVLVLLVSQTIFERIDQ